MLGRILVAASVLVISGYLIAPLYFNRAEPIAGQPQHKCNKHITDPANDPRGIARPNDDIKVIRFTNSGEFADRCDLTNVLYELNWDRPIPVGSFGATVKPGAAHSPKLVVLYIHGWKHSADPDDDDLSHFTGMITDLRRREGAGKRVVGIYVGWNASAGLPEPLETLSFWTKEHNADRIAQSSAVTMIVSAIGSIVRAAPQRDEQFIAIGHSFGARILYSASAQSLITATERAHPGNPGGTYRRVEGPIDAVILLNSAFEASRFSAMADFSRNDEAFAPDQTPLVVSIASDADWATTTVFPIGGWLGYGRTPRELTTIGNYAPYQTHVLSRNLGDCTPKAAQLTEMHSAAGLCLHRLNQVDLANENPSEPRVVQKYNPFIVAKTSADIMSGHNDIWNVTMMDWMAAFVKNLSDAKAAQTR